MLSGSGSTMAFFCSKNEHQCVKWLQGYLKEKEMVLKKKKKAAVPVLRASLIPPKSKWNKSSILWSFGTRQQAQSSSDYSPLLRNKTKSTSPRRGGGEFLQTPRGLLGLCPCLLRARAGEVLRINTRVAIGCLHTTKVHLEMRRKWLTRICWASLIATRTALNAHTTRIKRKALLQ